MFNILFLILFVAVVLLLIFDFWFVYGVITTFLFVLLMPFYFIIRVFQKKYLYGWKQKLGFVTKLNSKDKVIMYHGVSVGETIALENLIKKTKVEFPDYKIVVTTGTKTGQDIAQKKYSNIADLVTYFPFDIPFCVNSFLDKINPTVVLIAETELWPTFTNACFNRNIPLLCINGRMSDSTFKMYKILKPFFMHVLNKYTKVLTQSEIDNNKLIASGSVAQRTFVMKNLKFDVKPSQEQIDMGQSGYRIMIAGSTHHEENPIVLNTFFEIHKKYNDFKLLIAPRHTNRIPQIEGILKDLNLNFGYRSRNANFTDYDVIILDTMGELSKMYSICNFAFIGGSFNKTGGHNPLEASVYGKPTITGPSIHNFRDIYALLSRSNAGKIVKTQEELSLYVEKLLSDVDFYNKACEDTKYVFNDQQGALEFVISELHHILR